MDNTYDFIFHKGLDGIWCAVKRDDFARIFNNRESIKYRSTNTDALEQMIEKTEGDETRIDEFIGRVKSHNEFY